MDIDTLITRALGGNSRNIGATASYDYWADAPVGTNGSDVGWTITRVSLDKKRMDQLPGRHAVPASAAAAEALTPWPS